MKQFEGIVASRSGAKTIRVKVVSVKVHPRYGKRYRTHRYFLVNDERNQYNVGDRVSFVETKPISKRKHFRVVRETNEKITTGE